MKKKDIKKCVEVGRIVESIQKCNCLIEYKLNKLNDILTKDGGKPLTLEEVLSVK